MSALAHSLLAVLWHKVTPILGAAVLLTWGLTRCASWLSMQ